MPTECERSVASPAAEQHQQLQLGAEEDLQQQQQQQQLEQQLQQNLNDKMESSINKEEELLNDEMSTSQTSTSSSNGHNNGGIGSSNGIGRKTSITSPDPTAYVTKARVTKPTPPPPSYNPMQFVQIKPCNLYQTAQQQLKKAEEVKKIKEIKKEEPEDWQNNLDNWKSSRRKRVEHIIDRVVEVKKLELEEHDRNRRKSKTFSEMIEERGERPLGRGRTKLVSLAVYNEDESNDLSDLGIGTSSASGKSSQSEDYDNNSVLSDNAELDKAIFENNHKPPNSIAREYISSPGYDTSSSTAPGSSPDPCEYTYEGAIQDYKQRVSRATGGAASGSVTNYNKTGHNNMKASNESTHERANRNGSASGGVTETYPTRRGSKIEDRLIGFEVTSPSDSQEGVEKQKVDVPKIDISKRKEIFENQNANNEPKSVVSGNNGGGASGNGVPKVTLRDRFKLDPTASSSLSSSSNNNSNNNQVQESTSKKEVKRLSGDITSIRDRLQSLEQQQNLVNSTNNGGGVGNGSGAVKLSTAKSVDIAVAPLKDRLNSLQNAVTKEDIKKPPVVLIDARQLEIMKSEEETAKQRKKQKQQLQQQQLEAETQATSKSLPTPPPAATTTTTAVITALEIIESIEAESEVDRDDSGIHTSDDIELNEERLAEFNLQKDQEEQLNAAIAALAMEERQLEEAANAVNQIEAEFAELTTAPASAPGNSTQTATTPLVSTTNNNNEQQQQPCEMEFSINEALELALEAIDKETKTAKNINNNQNKQEQQQQQDNNDNINIDDKINKIVMMNQQQQDMMNHNETTNKTDEEKELKSKLKQTKHSNINEDTAAAASATMIKQEQQHIAANIVIAAKNDEQNAAEEDQEIKISKEPIYENISATSTHKVDADAKIIPNTINNNNINNINNKNNQNICKTTNNNSNNINNNNNNNNNFIEITTTTNAFANKTTATTAAIAENQSTAATLLSTTCTTTSSTKATAITTTQKTKTTTIVISIEQQQEQQLLQLTQNEAIMPQQQQQQLQEQQLQLQFQQQQHSNDIVDPEPYYQVPKCSEPYYDAPKHLRPIPVYENIDVFYSGLENSTLSTAANGVGIGLGGIPFKTLMEPPKEKPPPPPIESPPPSFDDSESIDNNTDTWSSDNTYETISSRRLPQRQQQQQHNGIGVGGGHLAVEHPSPPIKRMNSTKRIKKELRNKRSSFLGIEGSLDDDDAYLELTVAPPPDMAQLLQEERRLEKQLYMKAGLCDSSDTGESRDSGVSENHSRQSSEHYTNSSEENDRHGGVDTPPHSLKPNEVIYQNEALLTAAQTPLLQTVKGNSAESWTESATVAAAATKSLTEATATANAKMLSIEEKIREQEEVLRVERELLQLEQEELKRQRENLMLRENMARRELHHGAKMLMSANRRSLQDLNGVGMTVAAATSASGVTHTNGVGAGVGSGGSGGSIIYMPMQQQQQQLPLQQQPQHQQQIYANVPNIQQQQYYHQVETDYRKSMSDLNEFSKRLMIPPTPPTKPMRQPVMHVLTTTTTSPMLATMDEFSTSRQRHSLNAQSYGGSLVKIANTQPTAAPRGGGHIYSNYHHQSAQNLSNIPVATSSNNNGGIVMNGHATAAAANAAANAAAMHPGNMSRNTLLALSATPKPKYTDGWVQVQSRKTFDTNLASDPAWLSAYQQKRKSMPDAYHAYNNHWLVQEAEQRRLAEQQQRRSVSSGNTPVHQQNGNGVNILKANGNHNINSTATVTTMNNNGKPLPDSIIQTLTERVQSKGIGERKRFENFEKSPLHAASSYHHHQQQQQQQHHLIAAHRHANDLNAAAKSHSTQNATTTAAAAAAAATMPALTTTTATSTTTLQQQDKVLSVSGKKKCSHCGDELGRGAAMIIESLLLFYHINCFKCCVCHVQLGDGLNGTDVRVRNHKLHCQNCYSSDDGIKFSCV